MKHFIIQSLYLSLIILCFTGCKKNTEYITTSSDGVKISYEVMGKGSPAIVFVHGWTNDRSIWEEQVSYFSEKYKIISVDLAGSGNSGDNRENWTIDAFSEDVVAVINQQQPDKVILVGFSMGGPVIVETAIKIPEMVTGIILVDNLQNVDKKFLPQEIAFLDSLMMDLVTSPTREKLNGVFFKRNVEESYERAVSMLENSSQKGWQETITNLLQWQNEKCINSLKQISVPVIAINSDAQSTNTAAFRKVVPSFEAKIISDVGHLMMWDAPNEFNRLLEESIEDMIK